MEPAALVLYTAVLAAVAADPVPPPAPAAPEGGRPAPAPVAAAEASADPAPWQAAVSARLAHHGGVDLTPRYGFSVGATFERRHTRWGPFEMSAAVDLFHDRFSQGVDGSARTEGGQEIPFDGLRLVTHTTFLVGETWALRLGRLRPFVGGAVGMGLAYFSSDEKALRPGELRDAGLALRALAGLDLDIGGGRGVQLRGDWTRLAGAPTLTLDDGSRRSVFGDLLDVGVGFRMRF